jgi:hypothetical protein
MINSAFTYAFSVAKWTRSRRLADATILAKDSLLRSFGSSLGNIEGVLSQETDIYDKIKIKSSRISGVKRKTGLRKFFFSCFFPSDAELVAENTGNESTVENIDNQQLSRKNQVSEVCNDEFPENLDDGGNSPMDYLNYHMSWLKSPNFQVIRASSDTELHTGRTTSDCSMYIAGYYEIDPKAQATKAHIRKSNKKIK